jgi:mRNA-degrading endonuclease toxin of MazEF toxin-antitoxin module
VLFEKENIDTADMTDEMMITIMGGLAQEESTSISQNNVGNKHSPTVVVVPISSVRKKDLPVHIQIRCSGLPKNSTVLAEQIRTIDRRRLQKYVGSLDREFMKEIDRIFL